MKKQLLLSLLVAMLGMYCVPVHAQARASATHEVSVLLGGSVALGHSGISEQDVDPTSEGNSALDWGPLRVRTGCSIYIICNLVGRWGWNITAIILTMSPKPAGLFCHPLPGGSGI